MKALCGRRWLLGSLCGVVLGLVGSCKKEISGGGGQGYAESDQAVLVSQIRSWLDGKEKESDRKTVVIQQLKEKLRYEGLVVEQVNDSLLLALIPTNGPLHLEQSSRQPSWFIAALDENKRVRNGFLVHVDEGGKSGRNVKPSVFTSLFGNPVDDLANETLTVFNIAGSFLQETELSNGRAARMVTKQIRNDSPNGEAARGEDGCVTLWLVHTDVYIDRVEREWELLGTFCDPDEFEGSGGGSGGYSPISDCVTKAEENFYKEVQGALSVSMPQQNHISEINQITKRKDPVWIILKGFGGWYLQSQEIGVIKLVDAETNIWHWVSLDHGAISMVGIPLPGVQISYSQGVGTPSVYTLYAGMSINFTVTFHFVCNCPNIPLLGWIPPVTRNYTASCLWDSKPI